MKKQGLGYHRKSGGKDQFQPKMKMLTFSKPVSRKFSPIFPKTHPFSKVHPLREAWPTQGVGRELWLAAPVGLERVEAESIGSACQTQL
jgi:hypothetical protein